MENYYVVSWEEIHLSALGNTKDQAIKNFLSSYNKLFFKDFKDINELLNYEHTILTLDTYDKEGILILEERTTMSFDDEKIYCICCGKQMKHYSVHIPDSIYMLGDCGCTGHGTTNAGYNCSSCSTSKEQFLDKWYIQDEFRVSEKQKYCIEKIKNKAYFNYLHENKIMYDIIERESRKTQTKKRAFSFIKNYNNLLNN